jgi:hypothetical protein
MEAAKRRQVRDGADHDHFFPRANLTERTVKRGATVADTVKFFPQVVRETKWQTKRIANELKGESVYETCRNIWEFVYRHIRYEKDEEGREQVRSPARTWHDRFRGVDCDCYTVFISSILTNLGIPHVLRITKYKQDHFQHIYPIVPVGNGKYITIDCVVEMFDYEEPYSEKQDTKMDLQYLDGLGEQVRKNTDIDDLFLDEELGKLFKRKNTPSSQDNKKGKLKEFLKKGLHVTNRINPATVALRNGILAAMKLNVFKLAQRIKWAYLSEADARKKGVDIEKWKKLVKVREKLENIFYGAGGKQENLKKAILTGKGNTNKEVAGLLGYLPDKEVFIMNERSPLPQLIGEEVWYSENKEIMEGFEGIGELGEPVTATTIAAASGVLAAIAGLVKSIGSIFPQKSKGSEDFENIEKEDTSAIEQGKDAPVPTSDLPASNARTTTATEEDTGSEGEQPEGFWEKNKKWLKPTLWGVGGLGLLYLGIRLVKSMRPAPAPQVKGTPSNALEGLKSRKKPDKKGGKKKPVALL